MVTPLGQLVISVMEVSNSVMKVYEYTISVTSRSVEFLLTTVSDYLLNILLFYNAVLSFISTQYFLDL